MILVTGATGTIGKEVVDALLEAKDPFRVLVRNPEKVAHLKGKAEIVQGDLENAESLKAAMQDVEHLFLLSVGDLSGNDVRAIDAAKAAGVKHVVKLSTNIVDCNPPIAVGRWHKVGEDHLKASGLGWTMLHPGGFMSNAFQWLGSIKSQNKVFVPSGEVKSASIDPKDIAAVARLALTQPGHEGKVYELFGDEELSGIEQVAILARVTGLDIKAIPVTPEAAMEGMKQNPHMPPALIAAMGEMFTAIRNGSLLTKPNGLVEKLTGRKAGTFEAWCERNKVAYLAALKN
jgi:uncharacterized protein YbjT (DUF2867 family)